MNHIHWSSGTTSARESANNAAQIRREITMSQNTPLEAAPSKLTRLAELRARESELNSALMSSVSPPSEEVVSESWRVAADIHALALELVDELTAELAARLRAQAEAEHKVLELEHAAALNKSLHEEKLDALEAELKPVRLSFEYVIGESYAPKTGKGKHELQLLESIRQAMKEGTPLACDVIAALVWWLQIRYNREDFYMGANERLLDENEALKAHEELALKVMAREQRYACVQKINATDLPHDLVSILTGIVQNTPAPALADVLAEVEREGPR